MDNPVFEQLISQVYDLSVHWDNLVVDRDSWKKLAERQQAIITDRNATIDKLSEKLYECQLELERCQNPEVPDF